MSPLRPHFAPDPRFSYQNPGYSFSIFQNTLSPPIDRKRILTSPSVLVPRSAANARHVNSSETRSTHRKPRLPHAPLSNDALERRDREYRLTLHNYFDEGSLSPLVGICKWSPGGILSAGMPAAQLPLSGNSAASGFPPNGDAPVSDAGSGTPPRIIEWLGLRTAMISVFIFRVATLRPRSSMPGNLPRGGTPGPTGISSVIVPIE
jgi:hypothetical protein